MTALAVLAGALACGTETPVRTTRAIPAAATADKSSEDGRPNVSSETTKGPSDCAVSLEPGADLGEALAAAAAGAVLCLRPGRYAANLLIDKDVTLRGLGAPGETVLDGGERGAVVAVDADDLTVRLEGLVLSGGSAAQGGGVSLAGMSRVELVACVLARNTGRQGPGGAVHADRGTVVLERCRVLDNVATDGLAVNADGIASLRIADSLLVGDGGPTLAAVRVRDGADATIVRSTLVALGSAAALHASGTSSRLPEVSVSDSVLAGHAALDTPEPFPGKVTVTRSCLSAAAAGAFIDGGGTRVSPPRFAGGAEPYALAADSPACGLAEGGVPDLNGRARPAAGACAGAFQR
jgi:hypothetical protein